MKKYNLYIAVILMVVLHSTGVLGQNIDRYVIPAAGETLSGDDYSLQFTMGESYAQTLHEVQQLTQGFEQEWAVVTAIDEPSDVSWPVKVYPNLTPGILNIEVEEPVVANIFDVYGHLLKTWAIESDKTSVQIDELPSGMYIVEIRSAKGNRARSVKVYKTQ